MKEGISGLRLYSLPVASPLPTALQSSHLTLLISRAYRPVCFDYRLTYFVAVD